MGASATRRIRGDWGGVGADDNSLTTSTAWGGAGLWGQGQEFARPTNIPSRGSKVQTPSRQGASRDPVSPGRDGPIGLGPSAQCAGPHPRPHSRTTWGGLPAGWHAPTPELSAIPFRTEPAPNTRVRGGFVERTRRDRFDNPSPVPGVSEGAAQGSRRRTRSMRLPGRWRRPTLPHSTFAAGPRCKSGPPRGRTWLRARWPTPRLRRTPSNRASELVLRPEGWRVDGRPCA